MVGTELQDIWIVEKDLKCEEGRCGQITMGRMPVGFISMHAVVNIEQQENSKDSQNSFLWPNGNLIYSIVCPFKFNWNLKRVWQKSVTSYKI